MPEKSSTQLIGRFGVVNLKLEAESFIVEDTTFTTENVKELLLYAESKNCAYLKELYY